MLFGPSKLQIFSTSQLLFTKAGKIVSWREKDRPLDFDLLIDTMRQNRLQR